MHVVETFAMPAAARRYRGFTLVEVLAALVIVSLGMLGVIEAVSQTANNGAYLRERTIAHWIAMNRITEVRLEPKEPDLGTKSDELEMAGRRWSWNMEVTQTEVPTMRRIDVKVALAESKDESLAFASGFYGTALDKAGATATLWPGGMLAGGTTNPNPNDPKNPKNPTDPNTPDSGGSPPDSAAPLPTTPNDVPPPSGPSSPEPPPAGDPQ